MHLAWHLPECIAKVAQMVKNLPAVRETQVRSLGQGDALEKGQQPTPVVLPGEFHGQRALRAVVHGVAKSWTQPSDWHFIFSQGLCFIAKQNGISFVWKDVHSTLYLIQAVLPHNLSGIVNSANMFKIFQLRMKMAATIMTLDTKAGPNRKRHTDFPSSNGGFHRYPN